jgi:(1->4)-alpha-D-glucan 1-alpha-D-glucosylmutase
VEAEAAAAWPLRERLWRETAAQIANRPRFPESTYRLQFHAGFTFQDAARIVPYLQALGLTHCYASPYLKARPGSTHGYDIVDHAALNPEIGSSQDYDDWVRALRENGLGQILDIVPNHMGVATNENVWWNDVLENGPASRYAAFFDIAWHSSPRPELEDKILLPVLGEPYGDVLEQGEIRLELRNGRFSIFYCDRRFPIAPRTYDTILAHALAELEQTLGAEEPDLLEFQSILTAVRNLPDHSQTEPDKVAELYRENEVIKRRLDDLTARSSAVRQLIERQVVRYNGTAGDPSSFDLLDILLDHQCYRLSYWRVAPDEINYRRFFDINDLAALSMERDEVFTTAHALVLRLLAEGKIQGLRIDHPDGLYDPAQYFKRLQAGFVLACARQVADSDTELSRLGRDELEDLLRQQQAARPDTRAALWPLYVVVEKILGAGETLAESWAVHGTSGYDFVNLTNGLFIDSANEAAFTRLYREWSGDNTPWHELVYRKKRLILTVSLASELHMLTYQLDRLAQKNRRSRDFTFNTLRTALAEVIACFPVYRSYIADRGPADADRRMVDLAVRRATARNPLVSRRVFRFIRDTLLQEPPDTFAENDKAEQRRFVGKFQQVSAPVTAKAVEDTAFYVYNRLISLNEVGGEPSRFGLSPRAVHSLYQARQQSWPYALSPLSTHDTKRSEDVRARLDVLSELPDSWRECLERWSRLNEPHRSRLDDLVVPDPNEEYLFYQTLLGAWPLEPSTATEHERFIERIQAYMVKALHEAKVHTSWINPNDEYDAAMRSYVARVLDPATSGPFLQDFRAFQRLINHYGLFNSLSQTLLKIAGPGVADTYQGTEIWDFSLVDPDNRRPVDYDLRRSTLEQLIAAASACGEDRRTLAQDLVAGKEDGRIKLYVTWQALHCRRDHPKLFSAGMYQPLAVLGTHADHAFAFARHADDSWAIVVVPRLLARLVPDPSQPPLGQHVWGDTRLPLEEIDPGLGWRNVFTGVTISAESEPEHRRALALAELFADFPVALLMAENPR